MAQREAPRPQLGFQLRPGHTRAERRQLADAIQPPQLIHAPQVHGQHRLLARRRVDVTDNTRAAAIGDEARIDGRGVGQQFGHVGLALRVGHAIGEDRNAPAAQGHPVGQALATGVAQPVTRLGAHQRVGGQAAGRHSGQHFVRCRVPRRCAAADPFVQQGRRVGRQMIGNRVVAPAVPPAHGGYSSSVSVARADQVLMLRRITARASASAASASPARAAARRSV